MRQYTTFELSFNGPAPQGNEVAVPLKASFTHGDETVTVSGFYAGDGQYKLRFLPLKSGVYSWEIQTEIPLTGEMSGCTECLPAQNAHGPVRAEGLHFRYDDGSRYTPFGTTVYALIHQKRSLIEQTMTTLKTAPFNKIRLCVFPKHFDFNSNEPELFAFEKQNGKFDVTKPCYAFWDMLEQRLTELNEMGIEADLILFHPYDHWGFAELTKEECFIYLDYLTRRLAAFPNLWWSLANEYDLLEHFELDRWSEIAAFVAEHDPYKHLLSNHHCLRVWDFANHDTTHCCIQGSDTVNTPEYQSKYGKPVIFDECCYEGDIPFNWGNISGFELVHRFWLAYTFGGYCSHGETFWNEDELLWWAKGGTLIGESPKRIKFLRDIVESLPGDLDAIPNRWNREDMKKALEDPEIAAKIPPIVKWIAEMSDDQFRVFNSGNREIGGACGNKAFLYYYGRHCVRWVDITLPEDIKYDIEVIDVWDMTRKTVLTGVSGAVKVPMTGKESMAVLATVSNKDTVITEGE